LAVVGASTAVTVNGAAETGSAGGGSARTELAVEERWGEGIGEGEEWGDEEEYEGKRCREHFRDFGV
jgi:hypothetical protein